MSYRNVSLHRGGVKVEPASAHSNAEIEGERKLVEMEGDRLCF